MMGRYRGPQGSGHSSLSGAVSEAEAEARRLEMAGVAAAEAGDLPSALAHFHVPHHPHHHQHHHHHLKAAVAAAPDRASCYNNRAQARRLGGDVEGAVGDLDSAIQLSGGAGKAAAQAFTQRAQIWRLKGEQEKAKVGKPVTMMMMMRVVLKEDFEKAAALGSAFAQTQLVALNPYAAMCNKVRLIRIDIRRRDHDVVDHDDDDHHDDVVEMLGDMIGKLQRGLPEDQPDPGPGA